MGSTLIEKIVARNIGVEEVHPGQIVTVNVDRVMIHDIFIPFVADKFKEMGFKKLWDPDKVVLIYDHLVPTSAVEDVRHFKIGDAFAKEYGLTHVHRSDGICHQLMTEAGYAKPGNIVFGTDSHTTTYGALGAFGYLMLRMGTRNSRMLRVFTLGFNDPVLFLIVGLLVSAVLYFLISILPKMLERREKYDRQMIGSDSSHDLASPPGAEAYFDTGYSVKYSEVVKEKEGPMLLLRNEADLKHSFITKRP